jgi:hypothetical protein
MAATLAATWIAGPASPGFASARRVLAPGRRTSWISSITRSPRSRPISGRSDFFEAARVATISGFLANPEYGGNAGKTGWRAIGFDDRFVWAEPFGWYDGEGAAGE